MSKYTMTIQEYCLGRFIAGKLAADPDYNPALAAMEITPADCYETVTRDIFPDPVPFYSTDSEELAAFIKGWTDRFYFYEIGQDSLGKFTWTLRSWLRDNMDEFRQLYDSQVRSFTELLPQSDYVRTMEDTLKRTGDDITATGYGSGTTTTPNTSTKNRIIPLGETSETELSETLDGGSSKTERNGTDTATTTHDTTDARTVRETITGYQGADRSAAVRAYRELILDLNSEIYAKMQKDGLFMLVW